MIYYKTRGIYISYLVRTKSIFLYNVCKWATRILIYGFSINLHEGKYIFFEVRLGFHVVATPNIYIF